MAEGIRDWLENIGLAEYHDAFIENAVGRELLPHLTNEDLKDLGIAKLGDRKKLLLAIEQIGSEIAFVPKGTTSTAAASTGHVEAERRQLTVMFCDLVGSTALSRQLDPEDLRDVMRRYQDAVAGAITRYGGYVAKYLGDGVLAYFGWPQAYEDQAERAIRAGLDAIDAVRGVKAKEYQLDSRVGIATGEVVVGDLVGEEGMDASAVSGETPNMAARLQQVAVPGQVVVSETTRELVHQAFDVTDLGRHAIKGFDEEVPVWGVSGEVSAEGRFEAYRSALATPLVGRDTEVAALSRLWQKARDGQGQVVLISGEAGIGKSRLSAAAIDLLEPNRHFRIRYHCSPYHVTSPLFPAIQQLQKAAGIAPGDDDDEKLDKVERMLRRSNSNNAETDALFANLLSLPYAARYGELAGSPQQIKQATIQVILAALRNLAKTRPVLFLFEDTHWIDPTSLELLATLLDGIRDERVLMLITHRPEWHLPNANFHYLSHFALDRLGRAENEVIARAIAGAEIDDDTLDYIVSRTDGVPLFVEELTKTLAETDFEITEADIPATLQSSLLARLDRLGREAKELAQIGAVVGREFSYELLRELVGENAGDMEGHLFRLVNSELVFSRGDGAKTVFTFKHALVQEAAYGSLLRSRRQELHGRIARTLEDRFAQQVAQQPEMLARHFGYAGLVDEAISYWRRAAAMSVSTSGNREALEHFNEALKLIDEMGESNGRDQLELDVRVAQGIPAIAVTGYCSPEVEGIYLRARTLGEKLDDTRQMFPVLRGLWNLYVDRAQFATAMELAQNLVARAEAEDDLQRIALAHRALGFTLIQIGDNDGAHTALSRAVEAMGDYGQPPDIQQYGEDGGLAGRQYLAWAELFRGNPDRALNISRENIAATDALGHANSRAFARGNAITVYCLCHQIDTVMTSTTESLEFTRSHGIVFWEAHAMRYQCWALGHLGRVQEGLELLGDCDAIWKEIGALILNTSHQCVQAELHGLAGDPDRGLAAVRHGLELVERYDDRWYQAELLRIQGWLHEIAGDREQAAGCYDNAMAVARAQKNIWWLLQAANSRSALHLENGNVVGARNVLAPVFAQFSEGFDLIPLVRARSLLDSLPA